jgi:hypothetical protein
MPWENSQRLRLRSHPGGGCSASQRPVARLIGTLTTSVNASDAANAAAADHDHGLPRPLLARMIASTRDSVIPMGMTRPKVFSRPCSTAMRSGGGSLRRTGWTKA